MLPAQPAAPARGSPARGSPARGSLLGDSIPVGWDAARWNALIQQEQFDDDDIRQVVNYYPHSINNFTKAELATLQVFYSVLLRFVAPRPSCGFRAVVGPVGSIVPRGGRASPRRRLWWQLEVF